MRYVIVGAGAVGASIGGRLHGSGRDVVLVARGDHLAAMRADGLLLRTPDGAERLRIPVAGGPEELTLRADDVLLLTTKTQDTVAALDTWAAARVDGEAGGATAGGSLPVLCAQNGVENERLALRRFRRVYGVNVWLPATHTEPGVVTAEGAPFTGMLHVGRYPLGSDDLAVRVAADLTASHIAGEVSDDVMRWKYAKLVANTVNAVEALVGQTDGARSLAGRARDEAREVLETAGLPFASDEEQRAVRGDRVVISPVEGAERVGGSSFQSLTRGTGSIEADYLNGEIVMLGRWYGVPTPVNETLQRLAGEFAREGRAPGGMDVAELERRVAEASS